MVLTGGGTSGSVTVDVDSTVVRTTGDQSIAGVKTFTGTVKVDSLISHTGDDDTRIALNTNQVNIEAGGNCGLQVNSGSVIVNQDSGSVNFRVEGDTDAALLMANAATDKVGIGTTDPGAKLEVVADTTDDALLITSTEASADAAPVFTMKRNSGSPADGDYLGQVKFKGENDADQEVVYAKVTGKTSDVSDGVEDGLIETAVKKAGTTTIVSRQTHDALKLINDTGLEVDGNILSAGSNLNTLFSNCQGTVTSVGVATGLAGTGGTSPTLCIDSTCNTTWNSAYTTTKNLSGCAGLACVGDITSVGTDGTYLTGGATSGGACIGLNIACADKWDNASAGGVTNVTGGDGIDSSGGTTPEITVDSTVVRTTGAQSIAGVKTFTDHVYVNECIVHAGDVDTGMRFNTDGIKLETGGETHLCLSNTGVEVNVANNSNDFRVKTDDVDNSLFVSGSSNNVGAGTDIPNYKLTVANGDFGVANSNKIYVGGATTDSVIGYLGNTSGDLTLQGDGSRDVKIGSGTDPDAIFIKGTTGNVGLGTEAPGQKFVLSGDTGTNIQIQQNDGGGIFLGSSGSTRFGLGTGSNIIQATASDFGIGTQSGNSFTIGTDNTNRLHVKSTGEVGIGTDNPNQKLTVAGTLSAQSCIVGEAIVKRGGTSSQFLKADGSVDSASYTTCIGTVVAGDLVGLDQSSCPGILCTGTVVDSDLDDVNALISCPGLDCVGDVTGIDAGTAITVTDGTTATPQVAVTSACNTAWNSAKTIADGLAGCAGLACVGDITSVGTDGVYLTGGALTGAACIGLDIACANKWDNASAGSVSSVTGGDGIDSTGGTTPDISVDSTVVRTTGTQSIGGSKTFTEHVCVAECIVHSGDTNTGIEFSNDTMNLRTGGVAMLGVTQNQVVVNDASVGADFRVESNNDTHALFVDGSTDNIGIGTPTPTAKLTLSGAENAEPLLFIGNKSNAGGAGIEFTDAGSESQLGGLVFRHADGQSQGGGASFSLSSTENDLALIVGTSTKPGRVVIGSAGTASETAIGFYNDINTGLYRPANHMVGLVANGTERIRVEETGSCAIGNFNTTGEILSSGTDIAEIFTKCVGCVTGIGAGTAITITDGATATPDIGVTAACNTAWNSAKSLADGLTSCAGLACVGDVTGIDAGDGITVNDGTTATPEVTVDSTVVRTSGTQSIAGAKTFTGAVCLANGAPQLTLQDTTDNDDHSIQFLNNLGTVDYQIRTSDPTGGGGGDGFYLGSDNGTEVGIYTNGTTALTLDAAQSATFADKICVSSSKLVINGTAVTATAAELNAATSCVGDVTGIDAGTGITITDGSTATPTVAIDSACNTKWNAAASGGVQSLTVGGGISDSGTATDPSITIDSACNTKWDQSGCAGLDCVGDITGITYNMAGLSGGVFAGTATIRY